MKTDIIHQMECENIVADMIEFHRRQWDEYDRPSSMGHRRMTQKERLRLFHRAEVHREMIEFWQKVRIDHTHDGEGK